MNLAFSHFSRTMPPMNLIFDVLGLDLVDTASVEQCQENLEDVLQVAKILPLLPMQRNCHHQRRSVSPTEEVRHLQAENVFSLSSGWAKPAISVWEVGGETMKASVKLPLDSEVDVYAR